MEPQKKRTSASISLVCRVQSIESSPLTVITAAEIVRRLNINAVILYVHLEHSNQLEAVAPDISD